MGKMKNKFIWLPRYSDTDKPDKQGRWARVCFYGDFLICWISRQQVNETVMYVVKDYFPSSGDSDPCFIEATEDLEKAKSDAIKRFTDFINACSLEETKQ